MVIKALSSFSHRHFKLNPNFSYPQLQSHRGFVDGRNLENTIESIKRSYELGYEMVEFDVHMTSDQQVILFHDPHFKVGRVKKIIQNTDLSEMRKSQSVTTLKELFDWFSNETKSAFKLNIEIKSKNIMQFGLEKEVLNLIRHFRLESRIIISSFNPFTLAFFNAYAPKIFRAFLLTFERKLHNNVFVKRGLLNFAAEPNALHLRHQDWKPKQWAHLLNAGIPIALWTCNDEAKAKSYLEQGITSIITDRITPNQFK